MTFNIFYNLKRLCVCVDIEKKRFELDKCHQWVVKKTKKKHDGCLTVCLKRLSSKGVKLSALPMTGMILTKGESLFIASISISFKLSKDI